MGAQAVSRLQVDAWVWCLGAPICVLLFNCINYRSHECIDLITLAFQSSMIQLRSLMCYIFCIICVYFQTAALIGGPMAWISAFIASLHYFFHSVVLNSPNSANCRGSGGVAKGP